MAGFETLCCWEMFQNNLLGRDQTVDFHGRIVYEAIKFKNSEWGSIINANMIKNIKDFKVSMAGTLGNVINATPCGPGF